MVEFCVQTGVCFLLLLDFEVFGKAGEQVECNAIQIAPLSHLGDFILQFFFSLWDDGNEDEDMYWGVGSLSRLT